MSLALAYVITMILDRQGVLTDVLHEHQYYFIGSLLFAFTVFYAYVHFAQYFIIWNGNIPEETFWYIIRRAKGELVCHRDVIIIFGHFLAPFLGSLRIDVKSVFPYMTALAALWVWLMHYFDLAVQRPSGAASEWLPRGKWMWLDFGCIAFMVGSPAGEAIPGAVSKNTRAPRLTRSKTRAWSRRWAIIIRCPHSSRAANSIRPTICTARRNHGKPR